MSSELIFELGTEELPASFIVPSLEYWRTTFEAEMKKLALSHGQIETHGTPRRLTLLVRDVAENAPDRTERGEGPGLSQAFDADGKPTKAAEGFAKKWGVTVDALDKSTGRLVASRVVPGASAKDALPALLLGLIRNIPFKKPKMRWGAETETFPRPVQWILATLGGDILSMKYAQTVAGSTSRGHRFLSPDPLEIREIAEYLPKLREAKVLASIVERRERVVDEIDRVAATAGGRRVVDEELVDTITGLVEWPSGVLGSFGEDVLDMPREVLISEMRGHQKYASIETAEGKLLPQFVAVANTPVKDVALSRLGYQRVLRARLSDARYFFDEDRRRPLVDRVSDLRRVTFQEKLGSIHDKIDRLLGLSRKVAASIPYDNATAVERVCTLCKADLTTGMVGEFPDLQGVMGREYARAAFEREDVAVGIYEHYLPRGASDGLPEGELGAIVGITDRLDTIAGIFAIGKAPSGANDPFALRRACLGIIRVILHKQYRMSLKGLVEAALEQHYEAFARKAKDLPPPPAVDEKGKPRKPEHLDRTEALTQVVEFFRARLKALWSEAYTPDVVEAVLAAGFDDITDASRRLIALSHIKDRPDFVPIAMAFGRASNLIEKQAKDLADGAISAELFEAEQERALFDASVIAHAEVSKALQTGDYDGALKALADIRPAVDAFFDKVLVMAEDPAVKTNRLRLVQKVQRLFAPIADFQRIQTK